MFGYKGVGRKFSSQRKKDQKLAKNSLFQGGGTEKDRKIAKTGRKIALFSFYLLYLFRSAGKDKWFLWRFITAKVISPGLK